MHKNAERVQQALKSAGASAEVRELHESTRTAADAARSIGTTVAQIAKSLVFMAGSEPVLVIASGTNRVAMPKLDQLLGGRVRRPDADTVKRLTGFPIGGVPPVGHGTALRTVVDRDLLQYEELWAAAGTPFAVFPTTPAELLRLTSGEVADIAQDLVQRDSAGLREQ